MTDISLAVHLDRFVRRLHIKLSERAKEFDTDRVGASGALLLLKLHELGETPISTLAAALLRDKSQVTREVAALERKKMVERRPSPVDARSSLLALTKKGEALVLTHQTELAQILERMLEGLSASEVSTLTKLLVKAGSRHKHL